VGGVVGQNGGRHLAAMTWTEVAGQASMSVLAIPVGSTEQHGPHLPLSTDTDVAVALAGRLAAARPDVLVGPPIAYGSSGEHAGFPGTLSIGRAALELLLVELGRSADSFAGLVFVSAHGGNATALSAAVRLLRSEGRPVTAWAPTSVGPSGDAHAGRTETSVMLALAASSVRGDRAEAGNTRVLADLLPQLQARGVAAVSANGVLGDPTSATEEEGHELLDQWAWQLVNHVEGWLRSRPVTTVAASGGPA
jgi:creatinine amidohydrolase